MYVSVEARPRIDRRAEGQVSEQETKSQKGSDEVHALREASVIPVQRSVRAEEAF